MIQIAVSNLPITLESFIRTQKLDPVTWPKLICILRTYMFAQTGTFFEEVDYGDVLPPTTFVHAGMDSTFVLLVLQGDVHLYLNNSPNPSREIKPKPTYKLEKDKIYTVSRFSLPAFVLESLDENRVLYVLLKKNN